MFNVGDIVRHTDPGGVWFDEPAHERDVPPGELGVVVNTDYHIVVAHYDGLSHWCDSSCHYWRPVPLDQLTDADREEIVRIKLAQAGGWADVKV